jgi:hypothetical protein
VAKANGNGNKHGDAGGKRKGAKKKAAKRKTAKKR